MWVGGWNGGAWIGEEEEVKTGWRRVSEYDVDVDGTQTQERDCVV